MPSYSKIVSILNEEIVVQSPSFINIFTGNSSFIFYWLKPLLADH